MGVRLWTNYELWVRIPSLSLAKVNFDARMKEEAKSLASKSQEDSALDIADNREKIEKKIEKK